MNTPAEETAGEVANLTVSGATAGAGDWGAGALVLGAALAPVPVGAAPLGLVLPAGALVPVAQPIRANALASTTTYSASRAPAFRHSLVCGPRCMVLAPSPSRPATAYRWPAPAALSARSRADAYCTTTPGA